MRVLRNKLDSRNHYQKGTPQSPLSKQLKDEKEAQESQHLQERYPSVNSQDNHPAPQTTMVNDSNTQEALERNLHAQVMTTETSDRAQNQSSRQALMASIRARGSFIKSMDLSSDMNPDLAVVIEDTFAFTAQAINKAYDEELSETCSNKKENCDETSVYEDSYTLEH